MEILIIRTSALGDVVHCLPAAQLIKELLPEARITWLVKPAWASLLIGNPAVDDVIIVPGGFRRLQVAAPKNLWQALRKKQFDAVINFQPVLSAALCAAISGADRRFGFRFERQTRRSGSVLNGAYWLMTDALDVGKYLDHKVHVIDLNLRLAEHACQSLRPSSNSSLSPGWSGVFPLPAASDSSRHRIEALIDTHFAGAKDRVCVLIPGTTWDTKIWPADYWSGLGRLLREAGVPLVLVGGEGEVEVNRGIEMAIRAGTEGGAGLLNLTGETTLMDLVALFSACQVVIGGDTGPLHLAVAVGKSKVLGVYGSTPPGRNGPYGANSRTVSLNLQCQPCFETFCHLGTIACLKDLSVDRVYDELRQFVGL